MKPYSNTKNNPLQKRLKKIFEADSEKSTIVLREKCSDCGCDTIIEIIPTSRGYGLQGGALFMSSDDEFIAKCLNCYEKHFKIDDKSGK